MPIAIDSKDCKASIPCVACRLLPSFEFRLMRLVYCWVDDITCSLCALKPLSSCRSRFDAKNYCNLQIFAAGRKEGRRDG